MSPQKLRQPLIGAHMSIAGGVFNAIAHGVEMDCATIQLFTKSNNQWKAKILTDEEVEQYFKDRVKAGINPVVAHTSYLINIASPKEDIYIKSVESLIEEIERCHVLGIDDLVLHPGSYLDTTEEIGIQKIVDTLNSIFEKTHKLKTRIALETTAGQGTNLGYKFEQLARMIDGIENKTRVSVCMDTCHIFAAGYDIRDKKSYEKTIRQFDDIIGLSYLKAMHLNDSKMELGRKRDRHEHLGKGFIGADAFRFIMQDKRLKNIPKLLETPKERDGIKMDKVNLDLLRKFHIS
ncbi:MAG TPA: deoxyribonuclease IV [candidate division Zixibacteria bacterium]|nr:deoxyribonuclease IV [candidate division Zixibacteria bacterium]HEQ99929.1 deoxyribonuclease IV [candidate division Zixibacteria bacterium]